MNTSAHTMTEVELIARQHIAERAHLGAHATQLPRPRHAGRARIATTLRRVADRLDD
jgi:hypothetical protein